jgi:acylpyruvate hydrolase
MRLATYGYLGSSRAGAVVDDWMVDLERTYQGLLDTRSDPAARRPGEHIVPNDLCELLAGGEASHEAMQQAIEFARVRLQADPATLVADGCAVEVAKVRFLPPIVHPGKIVCLGLNYSDHAAEAGKDLPEAPELFAKFANSLIGHEDPIIIPKVSEEVDYEAELAVVIGRHATAVSVDDALDYVGGYTILNDISVRDYQLRGSQWLPGKTVDRSTPVGPWIVTSDEIPDPQSLEMRLDVDGEILQQANTARMVFTVAQAIAFISSVMTLEPGDVISTGTPHGVGLVREPPRWLRDGETVTVTVDGIGSLSNPVAASADR